MLVIENRRWVRTRRDEMRGDSTWEDSMECDMYRYERTYGQR